MTPEQLRNLEYPQLAEFLWRRFRLEEPLDPPLDTLRRHEAPEEFVIAVYEGSPDSIFTKHLIAAIRHNISRIAHEMAGNFESVWSAPQNDQNLASLTFLVSSIEAPELLPQLELLAVPWLALWRAEPAEATDGQFHVLRTLAHLQDGSALAPLWRDLWQNAPVSLRSIVMYGWARADPDAATEQVPVLLSSSTEIDLPASIFSLFQSDVLSFEQFRRIAALCDDEQYKTLRHTLLTLDIDEALIQELDTGRQRLPASRASRSNEALLKGSHLNVGDKALEALSAVISKFDADTRLVDSHVSIRKDGTVQLSIHAFCYLVEFLAPEIHCALHAIERPLEIHRPETRFDTQVVSILKNNGFVGYTLGNEKNTRRGFNAWKEKIRRKLHEKLGLGSSRGEQGLLQQRYDTAISRLEYLPLFSNASLSHNQTFLILRRVSRPLAFVGHETSEGFSSFVSTTAPGPAEDNYNYLLEDIVTAVKKLSLEPKKGEPFKAAELCRIVRWMNDSGTRNSDFYETVVAALVQATGLTREAFAKGERLSQPLDNVQHH